MRKSWEHGVVLHSRETRSNLAFLLPSGELPYEKPLCRFNRKTGVLALHPDHFNLEMAAELITRSRNTTIAVYMGDGRAALPVGVKMLRYMHNFEYGRKEQTTNVDVYGVTGAHYVVRLK